MARNKVGKATGETTSAGRPVYKTPEGELVSEKSVTFPIGDTWYNAPSIYDGERYTEDQVMEMVQSGKVKPTSTHKSKEEAVAAAKERSSGLLKYYDGGAVSQTDKLLNPQQHQVHTVNESQPQQYQPASNVGAYNPQPMAPTSSPAMADGGLLQEGGSVDPESGNDVPIGAMKEEVRDDIPAQLSEGEFVFPADVVRFIGLDRLMQLRQAAKEGLARMEEMGQMGNADEATIDDDGEFESDISKIIGEVEAEDELSMGESDDSESEDSPVEMAEGGMPTTAEQTDSALKQPQQKTLKPGQLKPTEIIKKDLARDGLTESEQTLFENLVAAIKLNRAVMVQENNTVFVGVKTPNRGFRVHMYTQDEPATVIKSIKAGIRYLKEAGIQEFQSETPNYKFIALLEKLGHEVNVTKTGDMFDYTVRLA